MTAFVFRSYICVHVCASATLCSKLLQSEILVATTVLGRAHWHATGKLWDSNLIAALGISSSLLLKRFPSDARRAPAEPGSVNKLSPSPRHEDP